jgi:hypothetical protein
VDREGNRDRGRNPPGVCANDARDPIEIACKLVAEERRLEQEDDQPRDEGPERIAGAERDAENPRVESASKCDDRAPEKEQACCDEQ